MQNSQGQNKDSRMNHFTETKKKSPVSGAFVCSLSEKRDSNSRPQPWQGCALPTELFSREFDFSNVVQKYINISFPSSTIEKKEKKAVL